MFENLSQYHQRHQSRRIVDLFDTHRVQKFTLDAGDLRLDYSKTNLDEEGIALLLDLANEREVTQRRDAMFHGDKINTTEDRAVLHTALRASKHAVIKVDGEDVIPHVQKTLQRMRRFAESVRNGEIAASDGQPFTDIVNIGIGGSDLGPVMACQALAPYHNGPRTHFVSNIDGAQIHDVLAALDPERSLVFIASKTFTTIETMTNAQAAMEWLSPVSDRSRHLVAISSDEARTSAFGIDPERVFGFEDWVGGRYSMWGPIGLSIMCAIGVKEFNSFLCGARAMDSHFQSADPRDNMPLLLGLIGVWHRNICNYPSRAILPYEQRLNRLPAYLQQLDMESNGKSVDLAGQPTVDTGPIVWGEPGTNGQHAFYQLIHQGTDVVPCEFMIAARGHEEDLIHQHQLLQANCLAQSRALMIGRDIKAARAIVSAKGYQGEEAEQQAAQRVFPGNRPSITLSYPKLTPSVLGQIIALYEHRVFVEGAIWGINSFDQWGVELGKELAVQLQPAFDGQAVKGLDPSTMALLDCLK